MTMMTTNFSRCRSVWRHISPYPSPLLLQSSNLTGVKHFSTTSSKDAAWGFIGLGAMGYPMAKNLRSKIPKDDMLTIFDVNAESTQKFLQETTKTSGQSDVHVAKSPKEVAQHSDNIVSALPEPRHVKSVFEDILSETLPKPPTEQSRLFIDCSTIDPTTSREVAKLVKNHGHQARSPQGHGDADFVDAPMSGGVVGASAGSLTFMVGTEDDLFARVEKILLLMGKKVWHMGPQGTGLSGKLANNYALAINNIGAAEAMNLGIKWGIKPKALADLINSATGRSWPTEINNPVPGVLENSPSSRDYEGGFGVSLMRKDLGLAVTAAKEAGARLELAEKAQQIYQQTEQDHKGKDFSVVYKWLGGQK